MPAFSFSRVAALAVCCATLPLTACDALLGQEIARLPINAVSTPGHDIVKQASVKLHKQDKLALWSEMDMSYQGEVPLRFQVAVLRNGKPYTQLALDPTQKNISVNEMKTEVNGSVTWRFSGKNDELVIPEDGTYLVVARLIAAPNSSLQLRKAELVLKK